MDYKDYHNILIGSSDVAALTAVGMSRDGLKAALVKFGGDDAYMAHLVDRDAQIVEHYTLAAEFTSWMKIYDDRGLAYESPHFGPDDEIRIYRAGRYGCIIQLPSLDGTDWKTGFRRMLDSFYQEQGEKYDEIAAMHPGHPDDLEMHWGQLLDGYFYPELDRILEKIREAGFETEYNSGSGRVEII